MAKVNKRMWFCREILRYVVYRQHFVKAYIHHSVNKCKSWFLNKEIIFVYRYPVSGTELHRWELFSFSCWPYIIHHQVERNLAKYVLPGIGIDAAVIQFKSASPCYLWWKKLGKSPKMFLKIHLSIKRNT